MPFLRIIKNLGNLLKRLLSWERRFVFGEEEWEIPLTRGKTHFEVMFKDQVTIVDRVRLFHPFLSGLPKGIFGRLERDRVALAIRSQSSALGRYYPSRHMFLGKIENTNAGVLLRGSFRTFGFFRQYALWFLNAWLFFCALSVVIGFLTIIDVTIEDPSMFNEYPVLYIIGAAILYVINVAIAFLWALLGVYFFRFMFSSYRAFVRSASDLTRHTLLHCAGADLPPRDQYE